MKKVLLMLLCGVMVLGAKFATADTRTDSMGVQAGQQIDDLDSIWLFPQDAAKFGNVADYRMGTLDSGDPWENNWFGVIDKVWDDVGYIGIYTDRPFLSAHSGTYIGSDSTSLDNQFGILTGNQASPFWSGAGHGWAGLLNPADSAWIGHDLTGYFGHVAADFTAAIPFIWDLEDPKNHLDLFWAKESGDTTLGFHINYADTDAGGNSTANQTFVGTPANGTNIAQTGNEDASVIGLDLGLGLKNLGAFDSLDLGIGGSLGSVDYAAVNNRQEPPGNIVKYDDTMTDNGIYEFRVNALLKSKISDTSTGRIFLNGSIGNLGLKQTFEVDTANAGNFNAAGDIEQGTETYVNTNLNVGVAVDNKVADGKAHVIGGLSFIWDDRKWTETAAENGNGGAAVDYLENNSGATEEETWITVPLNVAVEAPLFSWLKARVGARYNLYQSVEDKVVEPLDENAGGTAYQETATVSYTEDPYNYTNLYMGVGAEFQNFTLDVQVSEVELQDYLSTFQPGAGIFYENGYTLFSQAEAKYAF